MTAKKLEQLWGRVLLLGGGAGLVAMTWQASERIHMLKNPGTTLSCNLNPIVDCGSVLGNKLSALFGFPNAFIGMIVFSMLVLSGLFIYVGVKPNKAFRSIVLILASVLLGFSFWFFAVSLYVIAKVCIFCVVGWVVSVPIFTYTLANWRESNKSKLSAFFASNHINIIVSTYVIMLMMFLFTFSDYYFG